MKSWIECKKERIAKEVTPDHNMINSLKKIAQSKIEAAKELSDEHIVAKISLLYDALREYLESAALKRGYKIYNHECYASFIKDVLNEEIKAKKFDSLRKIRNGINYYGRNVDLEEGREIIKELLSLIEEFKKLI